MLSSSSRDLKLAHRLSSAFCLASFAQADQDVKHQDLNGEVQNPEQRDNGYSPRREQQARHSDDEHNDNNQRRERKRSHESQDSKRGDSPGGDNPGEKRPIQVYVGGIGHSVDIDHLKDLYREYNVLDVVLKGKYAFVEFESQKDANAAIDATNNIEFHGYKLKVEPPSKSHSQTHL